VGAIAGLAVGRAAAAERVDHRVSRGEELVGFCGGCCGSACRVVGVAVQGVLTAIAIEEADLAAEIYFEIKGVDGGSFQPPFASEQQSQNQVSC
jgi:hypothetical protein